MAGSSMRAGKCMAALMRRGVVPSPLTTVLRTRSGAGLPVGSLPPPTAPVSPDRPSASRLTSPFPYLPLVSGFSVHLGCGLQISTSVSFPHWMHFCCSLVPGFLIFLVIYLWGLFLYRCSLTKMMS
jgi:hypothetical protein